MQEVTIDGKLYDYDGLGGYKLKEEYEIINICGIPHKIKYVESDSENFGQIDYGKAEIIINSNISYENQRETICHEIVHGILEHLGYSDMSKDETFVQALGNAIYQTFMLSTEHKEINVVSCTKAERNGEMIDYQKYINALRKCAKEHENDRTYTGHIIVSDLCRDTANLLEKLKQEPKAERNGEMTNQEKFIQIFGIDAWKQMVSFSGLAEQFKEYWTSQYNESEELNANS